MLPNNIQLNISIAAVCSLAFVTAGAILLHWVAVREAGRAAMPIASLHLDICRANLEVHRVVPQRRLTIIGYVVRVHPSSNALFYLTSVLCQTLQSTKRELFNLFRLAFVPRIPFVVAGVITKRVVATIRTRGVLHSTLAAIGALDFDGAPTLARLFFCNTQCPAFARTVLAVCVAWEYSEYLAAYRATDIYSAVARCVRFCLGASCALTRTGNILSLPISNDSEGLITNNTHIMMFFQRNRAFVSASN